MIYEHISNNFSLDIYFEFRTKQEMYNNEVFLWTVYLGTQSNSLIGYSSDYAFIPTKK